MGLIPLSVIGKGLVKRGSDDAASGLYSRLKGQIMWKNQTDISAVRTRSYIARHLVGLHLHISACGLYASASGKAFHRNVPAVCVCLQPALYLPQADIAAGRLRSSAAFHVVDADISAVCLNLIFLRLRIRPLDITAFRPYLELLHIQGKSVLGRNIPASRLKA